MLNFSCIAFVRPARLAPFCQPSLRHKVRFVLVIFLLLGAAAAQGQIPNASPEAQVSRVIAGLENRKQKMRFFAAEGTESQQATSAFVEMEKDSTIPTTEKVQTFNQAARDGKIRYQSWQEYVPSDNTNGFDATSQSVTVGWYAVDIFDGSKQRSNSGTVYRDKGATKNHAMGLAEVQNYNRVDRGILNFGTMNGGKWYADVVRSKEWVFVGATRDPKYGMLYEFVKEKPLNLSQGAYAEGKPVTTERFWLAEKFDYLAVRDETRTPVLKDKSGRVGRPITIMNFTCDDIRLVNGLYMPFKGTREWTRQDGANTTILTKFQLILTKVSLKKSDVPLSLFTQKLTPGTFVHDGKKRSRIGESGETIRMPDKESNTGRPTDVRQWIIMGSLATLLVLGSVVLLKRRKNYS